MDTKDERRLHGGDIDPSMLETPRLHLRELDSTDFDRVHAWAGDPEVCRFVDWGPNTEDDTRTFLDRTAIACSARPRMAYDLGIVLQSSGKLIGSGSVRLRDPGDRSGDLGYVLHRAYWGQGFATEAVHALARIGFEVFGLHRLFATCRPENSASARVLEKVGMRFEGRLRHDRRVRGQWVDSLLFARLASDL